MLRLLKNGLAPLRSPTNCEAKVYATFFMQVSRRCAEQVVEERRKLLHQDLDNANVQLAQARADVLAARAEVSAAQNSFESAHERAWAKVNNFINEIAAKKSYCDGLSWWYGLYKIGCYGVVKALEMSLRIATSFAYGLITGIGSGALNLAEGALDIALDAIEAGEMLVSVAKYSVDQFASVITAVLKEFGTVLDIKHFEFYFLLDASFDVGQKAPRVRFKVDCIVFGEPIAFQFEASVGLWTICRSSFLSYLCLFPQDCQNVISLCLILSFAQLSTASFQSYFVLVVVVIVLIIVFIVVAAFTIFHFLVYPLLIFVFSHAMRCGCSLRSRAS